MNEHRGNQGDIRFLRRVLLTILLLALVLLLWQLRFVLILVFAAVLVAVILRAAVHSLHRRLHIPESAALAITVILTLAAIGGILFLFGAGLAAQAQAIADALPTALAQLRDFAASLGTGGWVDQQVARMSENATGGGVGGMLINVGDALTNLIIVIVGSVFLAANPRLYRAGLIKLIPPTSRALAGSALDDCEVALRLWFKGRLAAMVAVGLLTGIGLWLIGVPSFVALGLLAGLLEIIPFFGPLLAAIPGILIALLVGPTTALMATGLYLVIQQSEGNLITPIIQKHAVELPPALLLFSLLAFGIMFGILGVILAEPLTVAAFVLVKKLYVQEALHTKTPIPGDDHE